MNFLKLLFFTFFIFLTSCQEYSNSSVQDCGTSYSFDDPKLQMEKELTAKVRFVVFLDSTEMVDSQLIIRSMELLNWQLSEQTFGGELHMHFKLDEIVSVCSKDKKEDLPSFIRHANLYNKEKVFNVYVYGDKQPYMIGEDSLVRGRAAAIPSRTIAIRKSYLTSTTITHEMLHCLGLIHVHQKDSGDGYNVVEGDLVCDTKAINAEDFVDGDCNYVGPDLSPDVPEKYECNLMSYVSSTCRRCLTEGQAKRVKFVIQGTDILRECFNLPIANL